VQNIADGGDGHGDGGGDDEPPTPPPTPAPPLPKQMLGVWTGTKGEKEVDLFDQVFSDLANERKRLRRARARRERIARQNAAVHKRIGKGKSR
jgi:hypothetical protein